MVHVFDIAQTDGHELPEIPCHRLEGDGAAYDELTSYAEGLGFRVEVGDLPGEVNGLCNHASQTITVRAGLAPAQQTKTLAHEIAHAMLHGSGFEGPRDQAELEAESVAYIVMSTLGVDSAAYSFGYGPIGHEFVGVVEQVGAEVHGIAEGELVIAPFTYSDGTCAHCRVGVTSQCAAGGSFGNHGIDGGQGEAVRVPLASSTLVRVPGAPHPDETMRSMLTLSDVMCTGHHAAVSGGVGPGSVVAVVGDGAVGLCAVIAARRLGASRIIALSRNPARQVLARSFGAYDILAERDEEATEAVLELTDGVGVDAALECVGTGQSLRTAMAIARPGSIVGAVGAPHGVDVPIMDMVIFRNIGLRGGVAPARTYIPELLDDVLEGRIEPGRVFDFETDLESVGEAYAAMDQRRAVKSLLRVGTL